VRRIERNVGTQQLGDQLDVRFWRLERTLPVVRTDEEAPAAARGIKDCAVGVADAEGIYQVDDVVTGEVLAPPMAFLGT
jgi:hypothetical protein